MEINNTYGYNSTSGCIYIIRMRTEANDFKNIFKIGKCKIGSSRDYEFMTKLPFQQERILDVVCNNYSFVEKDLHIMFEKYRTNGEWFLLDNYDFERIYDYLKYYYICDYDNDKKEPIENTCLMKVQLADIKDLHHKPDESEYDGIEKIYCIEASEGNLSNWEKFAQYKVVNNHPLKTIIHKCPHCNGDLIKSLSTSRIDLLCSKCHKYRGTLNHDNEFLFNPTFVLDNEKEIREYPSIEFRNTSNVDVYNFNKTRPLNTGDFYKNSFLWENGRIQSTCGRFFGRTIDEAVSNFYTAIEYNLKNNQYHENKALEMIDQCKSIKCAMEKYKKFEFYRLKTT